MFNYDLLGYGLMALATVFIGMTVNVKNRADRVLRALLLIHGVFFSFLIIPLLGFFKFDPRGTEDSSIVGMLVLEFWCLNFLPVGILSFLHFSKMPTEAGAET
ncbi:MAG: hypothetical protein JW780_01135 [Clostridiales bacterium]|nr:hypothetical protein [Clostridiales bacterium]